MIDFPQVPPLAEKSLLGPDCLFSHLNNPTKEDIDLLNTHGGYFSTTPSTELQMGHGLLTWTVEGLKDRASMGVDCHTITGGSMAVEMRLALQNARALYNEEMLQKKVPYYPLPYKAQDVFNLGTIMGAKAVNMADKIGSIAVGKYADLVVWDGLSPSMIAAAEHDPVVAIVIHSTVRDIDAVIINGVFRKKDSKLLPVSVKDTSGSKSSHEWKDIAVKLLKSREKIQEKASKLDYYQAMKDLGWA